MVTLVPSSPTLPLERTGTRLGRKYDSASIPGAGSKRLKGWDHPRPGGDEGSKRKRDCGAGGAQQLNLEAHRHETGEGARTQSKEALSRGEARNLT